VERTRARLGSAFEWVLAAACILALVAAGSMLLRQLRLAQALTAVNAEEATVPTAPEPPPAVPSRAISVPMLLLSNGAQLRVGETASAIADKINAAWQSGADALERTAKGDRVTRAYDDGARRFLLVFEPRDGVVEPRVSAIYLR